MGPHGNRRSGVNVSLTVRRRVMLPPGAKRAGPSPGRGCVRSRTMGVLLGVVVGAILTFVFGQLAESRRRRAEIRTRLLDRRLDAFADFVSGTHEASLHAGAMKRLNASWKAAGGAGDTDNVAALGRTMEATLARVTAAGDRVLLASQVIAILCPRETYNALMRVSASITNAVEEGSLLHGSDYDEALSLIKADIGQYTGRDRGATGLFKLKP
jgi:hypothetical protein